MWKERTQSMRCGNRIQVRKNDLDVAGKFPQNLPARPTGRGGIRGGRDDSDAAERAVSVRNRFEDGHTLRAHRQSIGRILDVAACDDLSVAGLERGSDLEARVIGNSSLTGRSGGIDERIRGGQ